MLIEKSKVRFKMKKAKKCIYCGQRANTREHIPARNLVKDKGSVQFITVPSCSKCNSGFQKDEEFFRQLIASILYEQSPVATFLLNNPVARSMKRKPALGVQMFQQMKVVNLYSKGNIYLGKRTAINITKNDHQRVFHVLDKYIEGLFFYHFGKAVSRDWVLRHSWLTRKLEEKVIDTLKNMRWERMKEDTFIYGFNSVPKTCQSIWCLVFFGQPLFYSLVLDKNNADKFGNKAERLYKNTHLE